MRALFPGSRRTSNSHGVLILGRICFAVGSIGHDRLPGRVDFINCWSQPSRSATINKDREAEWADEAQQLYQGNRGLMSVHGAGRS